MLDDERRADMRVAAPDLHHAICQSALDLSLLLDIESHVTNTMCQLRASSETLIESSVNAALSLDFYANAFILDMTWNETMTRKCFECSWLIPPMEMTAIRHWYVSRTVFEQRLAWFAPFVTPFLADDRVRKLGLVLSGGVLPLCALRQEVYMDTRHQFLAYASEVYRNTSLDFFICGETPAMTSTICELLSIASAGRDWAEEAPRHEWAEDDDSWAARNRHGTTVYVSDGTFHVHLIFMGEHIAYRESLSQQHLPCVRASWDGNVLAMTASCFRSWMTRFVTEQPLFGANVSEERKAKTVFKYAMRGFGFSAAAASGLQLPTTLGQWLRAFPPKRPLPWYHPMYNPNMWSKAMTPQRERALLECVEI